MARQPDRPGFFSGLPLPSRTEGIVIAVLLLLTAIAVGIAAWVASNRTPPEFEPPANAAATERTTPPAGTTAPRSSAPAESSDAPVLAFYGDRFTAGTQQGGLGPAGWPAIVTERLGAESTEPHALTDAGYVATSSFGDATFVSLAELRPEPDADVTVVFGSRNDYEATPAQITAAATRTFEIIRAAAPQTRLLVIGPAWTDAAVPSELPPVRDAVREAAAAADVPFIDPLVGRWFFDGVGLIGRDAISPTDAGHAYLADLIEPLVRDLLAAAPATATGTR
ncbi:SGNH/GDSL hydrolase family protein [Blastococcus aggregatus]|uniref:SGNH/GDSL hydrolase family protein n=1 Tax=Blastococcus aggregatus TaxID=38502 RepID=UPI000BE26EE3|nr:SGNH/GDSL hydrolase family protein [Blastococcus aggregatus]